MRWSLPIGTVLGIRLRLHVTLLLFLGWLAYAGWRQGGLGESLTTTGFVAAMFGCILLHELGHSIAAMHYGVRVPSITLLPIGGVATMSSIPERPLEEFIIAAAGPFVNLIIAALAGLWLHAWPDWREVLIMKSMPGDFVGFLQIMNLRLLVFNLVPAFPMDGGRIVRALLAAMMDYAKATATAAWLGKTLALVFLFFGGRVSPILPFIGLFVFIGAGNEHRMVSLRMRLRGRTAADIMRPLRVVFAPEQRLADVIEVVSRIPPEDFAVMADGRAVGLLTEEVWSEAIRHRFDNPRILEIMATRFVTIHGFTQLARLFQDQKMINQTCFPVTDGGQIVGMVTRADLADAATRRPEATSIPPPRPRSRTMIDLG